MSVWNCTYCNHENDHELVLSIGSNTLTPDQLEEMDPEDIEAWQDANSKTRCCDRCGTQEPPS